MRRIIYIYQQPDWPAFTWDHQQLSGLLGKARYKQGHLTGKMEQLGFSFQNEALTDTLTTEVVKSNEIEGEYLNKKEVRSSVARHLGLDASGLPNAGRETDALVEMMLDATRNYQQPLTKERLFSWQSALFPTGSSGLQRITTGGWRTGPMEVVSGAMGKEKTHFEGPDAEKLDHEMEQFLSWFNAGYPQDQNTDPVLKSAIAHLWFVTIHPFDDGNGRIARAIADMQLARAEENHRRFYSMSAYIEAHKKAYYTMLEQTQQGSLDITYWLQWYLECLTGALQSAEERLHHVLKKADFWNQHADKLMNTRQKRMVNKLFDEFYGKLNTSKWAKMNQCSNDTALRDIQDLLKKGILVKESAGGRSTSYKLNI